MIVSFEEIHEIPSKLVRFYSVRLGPDPMSEFEKFDEKVFENPIHHEELQVIYATIRQIGMRGMKPYYFRPENGAFALPGKMKGQGDNNPNDYGVRLYVPFIHPNGIIILNGDIKTTLNPKDCPNVSLHFERAVKIGQKVTRAIQDNLLRLTSAGLEVDDSCEIDI